MKVDWDNFKFRASKVHAILGGNIGITEKQTEEMNTLEKRKKLALIGKAKALTPIMENKLVELKEASENKELPKGMQSELRKIWREETFKRRFIFTNKYVQKGIHQEETAITDLQRFYTKHLKTPFLFTKNKERFTNDWVTGEPDLRVGELKNGKWVKGSDTKCSWSLQSLPFTQDELGLNYEGQNQSYMWLTGAEQWETAHVLVNATEHQLFLEKQKWFYHYNTPSEESPFYEDYIQKVRECELMMIFDYGAFIKEYPTHPMEIGKEEWFGEDYDIPLENRVVIHKSEASEEFRSDLKERILLAREYLKELDKTI